MYVCNSGWSWRRRRRRRRRRLELPPRRSTHLSAGFVENLVFQ
jgi:hypothetical protein